MLNISMSKKQSVYNSKINNKTYSSSCTPFNPYHNPINNSESKSDDENSSESCEEIFHLALNPYEQVCTGDSCYFFATISEK